MEQMQMNMPDIYDAALYLRLSKDDMEEGDAKSESNSIANQRELLRSFVKSQPDIQIFDIYVDDGYSGGNFDRPDPPCPEKQYLLAAGLRGTGHGGQ